MANEKLPRYKPQTRRLNGFAAFPVSDAHFRPDIPLDFDGYISGFKPNDLNVAYAERYSQGRGAIDKNGGDPVGVAKSIKYPSTDYFRVIVNDAVNFNVEAELQVFERTPILNITGGRLVERNAQKKLAALKKGIWTDPNLPLTVSPFPTNEIIYPQNIGVPHPEFAFVFLVLTFNQTAEPIEEWSVGSVEFEARYKIKETPENFIGQSYMRTPEVRGKSIDASGLVNTGNRGYKTVKQLQAPVMDTRWVLPDPYVRKLILGTTSGVGADPTPLFAWKTGFPAPNGWLKL